MWIHPSLVARSGCPVRSHAWILIAMFRLAMDFISCESLSQGHRPRLLQRPAHCYGFSQNSLWHLRAGPQARSRGLLGNRASPYLEQSNGQTPTYHFRRLHKAADLLWKSGRPQGLVGSDPSLAESQTYLKRRKRNTQRMVNPTAENGVIVWGSTSPPDFVYTDMPPNTSTKRSTPTITTTTSTTTTTAASTTVPPKGPGPGTSMHKNNPSTRVSTMEPPATPSGNGKDVDVPPPKLPGETSGLAVHQIITITVSLIMVIAALITTLVLKNCCAQSGNPRRNSHQRKINQQEESCQNLTDFTPARVPSNLDIFTAYNETLQCSHECVRTPLPVYTEETILPPGDYKTSFNGNRIPLVNL